MKKSSGSGSPKLERKIVEKNRRIQMKSLCFKLSSLIPPQQNSSSKEILAKRDKLDHTTDYIKKLRASIDEMKAKKQFLMRRYGINSRDHSIGIDIRSPVLEIRDLGSTLEVILTSGMNKKFMLYEVISVLEEEGLEVVNVNLCTMGDKIFHTIYSQETSSRLGVELSRVHERLRELVY